MTVRKLQVGDEIPFKHGLEPLPLDLNWAWVAIDTTKVVGLLLAAPAHGCAFMMRLICREAPITCARALIRKFAQDIYADGYRVAFSYFNLEREEEARLVKLMVHRSKEHTGVLASRQAICVTAVEDWCNL